MKDLAAVSEDGEDEEGCNTSFVDNFIRDQEQYSFNIKENVTN